MSLWNNIAEEVQFNLETGINTFTELVPKYGKILDFGCGYGRIANALHSLGYLDIIGVDSSQNLINRGLKAFPHLDLFHQTDSRLPFADSTFDGILTCAVFTCIPDKDARNQVLAELYRVLKPQGVIHLAEFCSEQGMTFTSGVGVPMWHGTQQDIEGMLNSFSIEKSSVIDSNTMTGHASRACHVFARKIT